MKINKENTMISLAAGFMTYSITPTESKMFTISLGIAVTALLFVLLSQKSNTNLD